MGGYGSFRQNHWKLPIASHAEVGFGVFRLTRSSAKLSVACWGFVFRILLVWFWIFRSLIGFVNMSVIILSV